ncbi:MAG: hypothetical protein Q7K35_05075 [bacterium]|nr:hypothetical protein [bacterium]
MDNNQTINQDNNQAKKLEAQLKNYTGPEGITTKQLEAGLWYVEHKQLLKKIIYGFLILVGAISWTYTIYGFAYYLARGMAEDDLLARQLVQTSGIGHNYVLQISAQKLAIGPVGAIRSSNGKYDLYVQARNDNQKWWVEFDYYFITAGQQTEKNHSYIFPLETKYLFALAESFTDSPSAAALVMENVRWGRINQHQIPNWNDYYKKHLDILTTDIKFTPAGLSALSEKLSLNQLSFNITNNTAFNYWETGFTLLLYRGGSLVNINHYILNDFMSGQKRFVEISWPGDIGQVDKVEIVPEVNIMENDIYIKYEGGIGEEK